MIMLKNILHIFPFFRNETDFTLYDMNARGIKKRARLPCLDICKETRARMDESTEVLSSAYIQRDSVLSELFSLIQQGVCLFEHGLKETLGGGEVG